MRIIFWNIRAGGGRRWQGIFTQLQAWQPDIIALSEFRGTPPSQQLAQALSQAGWMYQLNSIHPHILRTNALLLASRHPLQQHTLPHAPDEPQRWLLATVKCAPPLTIGVLHAPNYTSGRKYPCLNAVLDVIDKWDFGAGMIGGDTNSGKRFIDEEGPSVPVFQREHDWMEAIEAHGWVDSFRHLHGDRREYTWYSHRNNGFRLDQAFLHPQLVPNLATVRHEWGHNPEQPNRREGLSDHAALIIDLT